MPMMKERWNGTQQNNGEPTRGNCAYPHTTLGRRYCTVFLNTCNTEANKHAERQKRAFHVAKTAMHCRYTHAHQKGRRASERTVVTIPNNRYRLTDKQCDRTGKHCRMRTLKTKGEGMHFKPKRRTVNTDNRHLRQHWKRTGQTGVQRGCTLNEHTHTYIHNQVHYSHSLPQMEMTFERWM